MQVRNFTKMAAQEQAPRFLRFLRMVSVSAGAALPRNQCMVLQALSEREAALLLFKSAKGHKARAKMDTLHCNAPCDAPCVALCNGLCNARCMHLVMHHVMHHVMQERAKMIADEDHLHKPRGRLVYHIELVGLLGACSLGKNAAAEMMVRALLLSALHGALLSALHGALLSALHIVHLRDMHHALHYGMH